MVDAIQRADLSFRVQGKIIEILVNSGDSVQVEDPLITLESDKASMGAAGGDGATSRRRP
mgnify:CR=1 FL=1